MLEIFGGPDRDRTDDLFHAMEARSQLRHRPTCCKDATLLLSPLWLDSSNMGGCRKKSVTHCGFSVNSSRGLGAVSGF